MPTFSDFMVKVNETFPEVEVKGIRYGQHIMNVLWDFRPELRDKIIHEFNQYDCYYLDEKVPVACAFLEGAWPHDYQKTSTGN